MCNLSIFGQLSRAIFGLILIALAWFGPQTSLLSFDLIHLWKLGWIGLIPLTSGVAAFCPIYAVFGFGHKKNSD